MKKQDVLRYIIVFFITLTIFIIAGSLSSFLNNRKLSEIKKIQDKISIDILSSETQFQLLKEVSCKDFTPSLSDELNELSKKIDYSENNIKSKEEVTELKRYYSLLQIKDSLLVQKMKEQCSVLAEPIFYFYTTAENCTECQKQSDVLTRLREEYPDIRVYSFDYSLNLSALKSLIKIFKIEDTKLPALIIRDKVYTGFQSIEIIEQKIPELVEARKKEQEKTKNLNHSTELIKKEDIQKVSN